MIDQQSGLFKAFKVLSLISLAVVLAGVSTVFVLALYQSCGQLDFEGVVCDDPTNQMLGRIGMTIMWACVYSVVPVLLALAGVYFVVARMMEAEKARQIPRQD